MIIAFLSILGAIPGLYLPETADRKMPETLEDMKEFGRHDRFFWMPMFGGEGGKKKEMTNLQNITSNTD